ncbi:hypothetical protein TSTA_040810 [Talaromyces stipitatus ATCC 10500]|uniref:Uncharacterized protein n=1 Tax=Talaromyces stipitatus (strain ATCC 10500 / CBS 375.48 / QM 6759 / NRRL 1006) TaxID=441959 RepID=B8MIB8_TALSN|nr:uncharacterized protein TSTA_040810 [Talaromyces stipitatus ATCC 10500]EED14602.1 hypothetical protein TSTA_040810 [Talaromyces stipitatus ATCC 10500]
MDWSRLSQIHNILSKFNKLTLFVSEKPQISLAVLIYYELHDLLDEASERKERFQDLDEDISLAVKEGMKKYEKYYTFMDASDTYYTALILDPRAKGDLLLDELEDKATGREILQALRGNLHCDYSVATMESSSTTGQSLLEYNTEHNDLVDQVVGNISDSVVLIKETTDRRLIFKGQDTCEFSRPEDICLGGSRFLIAMQAVDKHNTAGAYGWCVDINRRDWTDLTRLWRWPVPE